MTIVIILTVVLMLQTIIIGTAQILLPRKSRQPVAEAAKEPTEEEKRLSRIQYSAKRFLPDGTIHLVYQPGHKYYSQWEESSTQQVYDVNDNLLWEGIAKNCPYKYLSWTAGIYGDRFQARDMRWMNVASPDVCRTLDIPVRSNNTTVQIWRYVAWRQSFIGYKTGGGIIGYAGATGFTNSPSQARGFGKFGSFVAWCPKDSFSPTLLWETNRSIYEISFEKRKVELVFESPDVDIDSVFVQMWGFLRHRDTVPVEGYREGYRPLIRCRTKDGKDYLVMRDPAQRLTIETPEEWSRWKNSHSRFAATTQAIFLKHQWTQVKGLPENFASPKEREKWWRDYQTKPKKHWVELYKVDDQGNIELINRYGWTEPGQPPAAGARFGRIWDKARRCVSKVSPPLYDLSWHLIRYRMMSLRSQNDVTREVLGTVGQLRPRLSVWNWLLGALMVGFACFHGWPRRTSRAGLIFWLVFVWLFNLAGLLTYLALNHTTVIKCPVCGKRRGLAQARCVRCQAKLPVPQRGKLDLISDIHISPAT